MLSVASSQVEARCVVRITSACLNPLTPFPPPVTWVPAPCRKGAYAPPPPLSVTKKRRGKDSAMRWGRTPSNLRYTGRYRSSRCTFTLRRVKGAWQTKHSEPVSQVPR